MATSGARKSKGSRKLAARPAGAGKLRELIAQVIGAQHRGDQKLRDAAISALEKIASHGAPELRQSAAEALAAAGHPVAVDSARHLDELAARLDARR